MQKGCFSCFLGVWSAVLVVILRFERRRGSTQLFALECTDEVRVKAKCWCTRAEHPEKFTPSAGKITAFHQPGGTGVRVATLAYAEGVIPPYYDSLIAKLIVRGKDRNEAISRMSRALEMFIVEGVLTTIPLHRK